MKCRAALFSTLCAGVLAVARPATATLIALTGHATVDSENFFTRDLLPLGTVVTASLRFQVHPGLPRQNPVSGGSGTFRWNDGIDREFTVNGTSRGTMRSVGSFAVRFPGSGPTVGDAFPKTFLVVFDLGVNPFTTSEELSDLILQSDVQAFGAVVKKVAFRTFTFSGDLSASIHRVPEPAAFGLFAIGLFVVLARHRRR